mmetsp:Transcript_4651/g.13151  ORF Transcript_4651/g.13151 Transcript_4651/m.13151 type:complete len:174 (-) Transcript_4651:310-831(-)
MAGRRTLLLMTSTLTARSSRQAFAFTAGRSALVPVPTISKRWMEADSGDQMPPINRVQKDVFSQIIDEYESEGRDASGYVVIDVRGEEEVAFTGKVSPNTYTLPLPLIAQEGAFNLDDDDFEEQYGWAKPGLDETLVFTCKAGVRSNYAAQYAAMSGYSKLFDYIGGADEWFR